MKSILFLSPFSHEYIGLKEVMVLVQDHTENQNFNLISKVRVLEAIPRIVFSLQKCVEHIFRLSGTILGTRKNNVDKKKCSYEEVSLRDR